MSLSVYEASAPLFVRGMGALSHMIDKAIGEGADEAAVLAARLAPDMRPFPNQIQMASDSAKNAIARLTGVTAPSMPDTEASFAELKERCAKTIAFVEAADREALEAGADRDVEVRFPNGMGYRFKGRDYLTGFALPNFYFHVTTAYALLRAHGLPMGKGDYLRLGMPVQLG